MNFHLLIYMYFLFLYQNVRSKIINVYAYFAQAV